MQAIVRSHGKAIIQTANGSLISTYSAFSGSSLSGVSLITINSQGNVHVKKIKNATLIRMYQKHTIRSVYNSSAQRIVIGSAGVSVTQVRASNNSLQSVQQIIQRRHQQNAGAAATGGNAAVVGGKLKGVGNYGSGFTLKQTGGGQMESKEGIDESFEGESNSWFFSSRVWKLNLFGEIYEEVRGKEKKTLENNFQQNK